MAMLAVKNKSISLLWELNSFFIAVNSLRKNSIVLTPNMAALLHGCKPRIVDFSNHLDLQYIFGWPSSVVHNSLIYNSYRIYYYFSHVWHPIFKDEMVVSWCKIYCSSWYINRSMACIRTFKNSLKQVFKSSSNFLIQIAKIIFISRRIYVNFVHTPRIILKILWEQIEAFSEGLMKMIRTKCL